MAKGLWQIKIFSSSVTEGVRHRKNFRSVRARCPVVRPNYSRGREAMTFVFTNRRAASGAALKPFRLSTFRQSMKVRASGVTNSALIVRFIRGVMVIIPCNRLQKVKATVSFRVT